MPTPSATPGGILDEILIDDATWEAATPARRLEWSVVLDELLADHRFGVEPPSGPEDRLRLLLTVRAGSILCDARTRGGRVVAHEEIALEALDSHLREYFAICREMGELAEGVNSPKLEALDIAKRLVHDESAETVQSLFRALRPDHATARRLFTMIVTLHFDTTRLVRPHHLDATLDHREARLRGH